MDDAVLSVIPHFTEIDPSHHLHIGICFANGFGIYSSSEKGCSVLMF